MGVDEEGELCIKSPAVCAGYHNNPDVTKQQIVNGWLHTGDLGSIDNEGFVSIVGRKKDLITAGGKNVSPCEMEASIMTSPVVSQCVMIGDRKPFIAAIISLILAKRTHGLRRRARNAWHPSRRPPAIRIVRAEVERAVNKANELASRAESIRKSPKSCRTSSPKKTAWSRRVSMYCQAVVDHYRTLIDTVIYVPKNK